MGPWFDASRSERRAAIHEEINRLGRADRIALILCGLEGRPIEQAARDLRWPANRLARRLSWGLERLRVRLARRFSGIPVGTWDSGILVDLGAIVPKSLIESTVAAATCRPRPPCRSRSEMNENDQMSADSAEVGSRGGIQELLARIKNGDDGAARELLARYEPKIRLVVRRQLPRLLRSRFDSLDFLQSVWGSFFHKIRTGPNDLDEEQNLITFLAWAARNKVIDEYRRAATQKQDIHREEALEIKSDKDVCLAAGDTPSQLAQAHETYDRLRDLLPADRQVILELKAAGYSCKEIGSQLGISERTVQRVLEDLKVRARLGG